MISLLHISPSYYPAFRFGGPIQSVHLLNKALVKKSIKVDVLTTNAGLTQDQREQILRQAQDDKEKWNDVDGVRVKYCDFVGYEHYNFSLEMVKEIWKIIDNYDLIHITAVWNFPVLAGALISLIKKKPYIISPRGTIYKETIELKSTSFKKLYFSLFAKHYLNKASAIHFTTEDEKIKVTEYLNLKAPSFIIPNGIDLRETEIRDKKSEISIKEKYILILGRIDRKKGFDLLLPAFAKIANEYSDLNLVIAGDDTAPYAKEVKKMIEEQKISDKVIFTGQVTGDDKWTLYKNALMFVLPSYSENFGMSVIEAMASGCSVVISDKVGIYKEVIENNAGMIVETKIISVVFGLEKLLTDENLRTSISKSGKEMVSKYYDITKAAIKMIQLYEWILYKKEKPEFVYD